MPQPMKAVLFDLAERAIVNLYDGGVLSPAVLERVLAAFAGSEVEWETPPSARSIDGRSLHAIVVSIMLPGKAPRNVSAEFARIVEHVAAMAAESASVDARASGDEEGDEAEGADDELVSQLSASAKGTANGNRQRSPRAGKPAAKRQASQPAADRSSGKTAGFNPFVNAALPLKGK